jgi:Swiss Army Knife RNA repair-like protein
MRCVFLDFDGVLNSDQWQNARQWKGLELDPGAVKRLNRLNYLDVRYVISSSWRLSHVYEGLYKPFEGLLHAFGFTGHVIGRTPYISGARRGEEINAWLTEQPAYDNFVIFDDDSDMDPVAHRLVQTDWRTGLQEEHIDQAINMLRLGP